MKSSYWEMTASPRGFGKLKADLKVDVVVIGGGMTGITAAYLLKRAGKSVALLERDRCLEGETGRTTAHLTAVTDLRMSELVKLFGKDNARATWDAGLAAIHTIEENIALEKIDCEFRRVPGYLHAPIAAGGDDDRKNLEEDAQLAAELGFDVQFLDNVPIVNRSGFRIANQAKFHPLKYLAGLLKILPSENCHVFEESEVTEFNEDPLSVKANDRTITCDYIVIATHVPLQGLKGMLSATLFQSKLAPYSSYALGAKLKKGEVPEACWWDTSDPYYYLRIDAHETFDYAIFGGKDHKTGQTTETEPVYAGLEAALHSLPFESRVDRRWSGQVWETNDGLPLIGEIKEKQFVATGYAGNGMTFGTLGGMMAADAALANKNPWTELFDPHRKKLRGGTWDYIKENLDYPYYMIKDRLNKGEREGVESVGRNEGKILKVDGQRVACYRNPHGKLIQLSPVCTHMGCIVHWNTAERTWDCPCHGSRFQPTGEVIGGPAETPLELIKKEEPKK
jgi:glycine/D-amino acid oxidase-like deaminating enzyme/nitrite reductase/ring-hydroxylating ferredoxin subunit